MPRFIENALHIATGNDRDCIAAVVLVRIFDYMISGIPGTYLSYGCSEHELS